MQGQEDPPPTIKLDDAIKALVGVVTQNHDAEVAQIHTQIRHLRTTHDKRLEQLRALHEKDMKKMQEKNGGLCFALVLMVLVVWALWGPAAP